MSSINPEDIDVSAAQGILDNPEGSRILVLRAEIRRHNHLYYDLDSPAISDTEYDALVAELKALSPDDLVFSEIGNPTYGTEVEHSSLMGSLDKVHSVAEIMAKFAGKIVCVMPKIDGLSLALRYRSGCLDWAATRGDGKTGELVTPTAAHIRGIPMRVNGMSNFEVRGEGYIAAKDFYGTMDQPGYDGKPDGYANPRNAAAGGVRQKNPVETFRRQVRYVAYKIMGTNGGTQTDVLRILREWGFEVPPSFRFDLSAPDAAERLQSAIDSMKSSELPYDIDGVVIMLDDLEAFEAAGWSGKYPKGAVAFKYETEKAASKVVDIEWSASRTGRIVPVLVIEPTEICGTKVDHITLNNAKWFEDRDIGVGDRIEFEKAGEIIPQFLRVLDRAFARIHCIPEGCPTCGSALSRVDKGGDIVCPNEECPAKFIKHIRRILELLDVKGLDEKTIDRMDEAGLLPEVWSVFGLSEEDLVSKGFGKGQASNWIAALRGVRTTPDRLLACMGIPGWGQRMFELLFKNSPPDMTPQGWLGGVVGWPKVGDIVLGGIQNVKGVGPEKARALKDGLNAGRWKVAKELMTWVAVDFPAAASGDAPLAGKSFCCTGTLSKERSSVQDDIRAAGGEVKESVSKNLGFLVAGPGAGSKLQKAESLGVKVIDEAELYRMIGSKEG